MKKNLFIFLLSLLVLAAVFFVSCSSDDIDPITMKDKEIERTLSDEYEMLNSRFTKKPSFSDVCKYVDTYVGKYDLKKPYSGKKYAVYTLPPHNGYETADSVTIQMPVNYFKRQEQNQILAVLTTLIKSTRAHGKIDIVLSDNDNGSFAGAKAVDRKYIDKDNFINLAYTADTSLYNQGAAAVHSAISCDYRTEKAKYSNTYRISISGLNGGSLNNVDSTSDNPSPVNELANLLVAMKTSGNPFELVSFEGGKDIENFAESASIVVSVPGSEKNKLLRRYEKRSQMFDNNFSEKEPHYSYSLISSKPSNKAIRQKDSDKIINILYTLDSGIRKTDEKKISSIVNLGKISTKGNEFRLDIGVRDTDIDSLRETLTGFSISCGLFKADYHHDKYYTPWITFKESPLVTELSKQTETDAQTTIMLTENTVFKDRIPTLNAVTLGVNVNDGTNAIKALSKYFTKLNAEKDD